MDKQETLDKFYTHYPQFKNLSFTGQEFSWLCIMRCNKWAMMNRQRIATLESKLEQRNLVNKFAQFIPTRHAQMQLNEIASQFEISFCFKRNQTISREIAAFYHKI
jgi:ABC-2 type transport system permease protein